jgi:hypothetical protein
MPVIRTHYIYVSKDVRIRGYFSKPLVREQKCFGNTALNDGNELVSRDVLQVPVLNDMFTSSVLKWRNGYCQLVAYFVFPSHIYKCRC